MFIELIIKGFIIGIAFVIPGVSGGTLAVYLGVYEKLIDSISKVFQQFKTQYSTTIDPLASYQKNLTSKIQNLAQLHHIPLQIK